MLHPPIWLLLCWRKSLLTWLCPLGLRLFATGFPATPRCLVGGKGRRWRGRVRLLRYCRSIWRISRLRLIRHLRLLLRMLWLIEILKALRRVRCLLVLLRVCVSGIVVSPLWSSRRSIGG